VSSNFWFSEQPTHHPAGFRGTWSIQAHDRIPDAVLEFLQLTFGVARIDRVSLDDINAALNHVWDGDAQYPGAGLWSAVTRLREDPRTNNIRFDRGADQTAHSLNDTPLFSWDVSDSGDPDVD